MVANGELRTRRLELGLTLDAFGAKFGVHKTTVLRWEEKGIPAERVPEISKATGLSRETLRPDLFGQEEA